MNWRPRRLSELGTFDIHQTWSGQVSYYQYYLPKGPITAFSYVWPPKAAGKKPGIITNDVFAIPKGAKSPFLAHAWIDYLLEPSNAAVNYAYEGFQLPLTSIRPESTLADELAPKNLSNFLITQEDSRLGSRSWSSPQPSISYTSGSTRRSPAARELYGATVTGGA